MSDLRAPIVQVAKKSRKSTPRNTTGCLTCRIRHVKCDEQRPACRRCTSTGRRCDGYRAAKDVRGRSQATSAASGLEITSYEIPFRIPGGKEERRVFHYFCVQGSAHLSGWLKSDFWSRIVLRCSHEEPVARQALIALSSAHLECSTQPNTLVNGTIESEATLQQYNRALRRLRNYLATQQPSRRVVLVCCLLLYAFEGTRGDYESGLKHLQNGIEISQIHRDQQNNQPALSSATNTANAEIELQKLSDIFSRTYLQAVAYDLAKGAKGLPPISYHGVYPNAALGNRLSNLEDAQVMQIQLENQTFHYLRENIQYVYKAPDQLPHNVVEGKLEILERHYCWSEAFSDFLEQQELHVDIAQGQIQYIRRCAKLLRMHYLTSLMLLISKLPWYPDVYDHGALAEEMLESATALLEEQEHGSDPKLGPSVSYSSETGVASPLFAFAAQTANQDFRRRALLLLTKTGNRREGLYDAKILVRILEMVSTWHERESTGKRAAESLDAVHKPLFTWALMVFRQAPSDLPFLARRELG